MRPLFTGIEELSLGIVVADRHSHPAETHEHKEIDRALGLFVIKNDPDVFLDLDDRWDLPGLNEKRGSSIMGTAPPESNHDIFDELQVGNQSLHETWSMIERENERHRRAGHKERCIEISKFAGLGNHSDFLTRANKKHHSTKKIFSINSVKKEYEKWGFEVANFLQPIIIAGISCRHYIPGDNMAALAPDRHFGRVGMSSISAHKHRPSVRTMTRDDGARQTNIVTPCFKHPDRLHNGEDSGLTLIRNARGGEFRYEFVGIEEVLQELRDERMKHGRKMVFG
jgi:hypothetical protein